MDVCNQKELKTKMFTLLVKDDTKSLIVTIILSKMSCAKGQSTAKLSQCINATVAMIYFYISRLQ